jgi:hypothetical protein
MWFNKLGRKGRAVNQSMNVIFMQSQVLQVVQELSGCFIKEVCVPKIN